MSLSPSPFSVFLLSHEKPAHTSDRRAVLFICFINRFQQTATTYTQAACGHAKVKLESGSWEEGGDATAAARLVTGSPVRTLVS